MKFGLGGEKIETKEDARRFLESIREAVIGEDGDSDEIEESSFDLEKWGIEGVQMLATTMHLGTNSAEFFMRFMDTDPVRLALLALVNWLQWTQDEVAAFLGVSKGRVSQYINSADPIPVGRVKQIHRLLFIATFSRMIQRHARLRLVEDDSEDDPKVQYVTDHRVDAMNHIVSACYSVLLELKAYEDSPKYIEDILADPKVI
ncbi:MAG: helix-turn-helix transcriptional regulator [Gammaproteobacteria bacterium]|nr:helix-turn-helix transcriptional regulator [Gammaproteobacteria bacterium]